MICLTPQQIRKSTPVNLAPGRSDQAMARHLGLHLSRQWTMALIDDQRLGISGFSREYLEVIPVNRPSVGHPSPSLFGSSLLASICGELTCMELSGTLYLWEPGDGSFRVLPGSGDMPRDVSIAVTTWEQLLHRRPPNDILITCISQFFRASLTRFEDVTGKPVTPLDSITIALSGWGACTFHAQFVSAPHHATGIIPTTLWRPTACAGWALCLSAIQWPLIASRPLAITVKHGDSEI